MKNTVTHFPKYAIVNFLRIRLSCTYACNVNSNSVESIYGVHNINVHLQPWCYVHGASPNHEWPLAQFCETSVYILQTRAYTTKERTTYLCTNSRTADSHCAVLSSRRFVPFLGRAYTIPRVHKRYLLCTLDRTNTYGLNATSWRGGVGYTMSQYRLIILQQIRLSTYIN